MELDKEVINASKENLPWAAWNDERANDVRSDSTTFVQDQAKRGINYHVSIQDSSDPFWYEKTGAITILPSSILFELSYFKTLCGLL